MALKKEEVKVVFGETLIFSNAYHKITSITGNKDLIFIHVDVYKDENKDVLIDSKNYLFSPSFEEESARWDKQGYEFMKTKPEYNGAIDV